MYRYTTGGICITMPERIDLTLVTVMRVAIRQGAVQVVKDLTDGITIDGQDVIVRLTQEDTAKFRPGAALVQAHFRLSTDGVYAMDPAEIDVLDCLDAVTI